MKKILFPVDMNEVSEKALGSVKEMAKALDAEIVVIHVMNHPGPISHPQLAGMLEIETEKFRFAIDKMVEDTVGLLTKEGFKVTSQVLRGNPANEIVEFAISEKIDMIVMASRNMGAVKRFLIGSVTNNVVHHATVPVLVVRG